MEQLPQMKAVLAVFTTKEVTPWRVFEAEYGAYLRASPEFADSAFAETQWEGLQTRLSEHNIRVMSTYYSRMRTTRMAELLELPEADAERHLSNLVSSGTVYAKIDRPARIVVFKKKDDPNDVLNGWASGLAYVGGVGWGGGGGETMRRVAHVCFFSLFPLRAAR